MSTTETTRHYGFIDALRGYAILAVMVVHSSQIASDLPETAKLLANQGARGVQLFFVVSALTLIMSWRARHDGLLPFYLRRFFRIAPMFWLGILFFLWLDGYSPRHFAPNGISEITVLLTVFFLHGWHPETMTSVVPGGWSIAVEMAFYAIFPLLVSFIRSWKSATFAIVIASVLGNLMLGIFWVFRGRFWHDIPDDLIATFLTLWFPAQLQVFIIGFLLYYFLFNKKYHLSALQLKAFLFVDALIMVALAIYPVPARIIGVSLYLFYGLCFGVFAYCLANGAARWLINAPVRYLGQISFSAYLWHFAVIESSQKLNISGLSPLDFFTTSRGLVFFIEYLIFVIVTTTLFSTLTYRYIERPMILLGNRVIKKITP